MSTPAASLIAMRFRTTERRLKSFEGEDEFRRTDEGREERGNEGWMKREGFREIGGRIYSSHISVKGRNRARFEFKAASVNGFNRCSWTRRGEFRVFRVNCEWSPILLAGRKSGEEVEGRQAMNGRAVKLNRSREASEDPV